MSRFRIEASISRKLVFLSSNPDDALREEFDARLDNARSALAPALMDVSFPRPLITARAGLYPD